MKIVNFEQAEQLFFLGFPQETLCRCFYDAETHEVVTEQPKDGYAAPFLEEVREWMAMRGYHILPYLEPHATNGKYSIVVAKQKADCIAAADAYDRYYTQIMADSWEDALYVGIVGVIQMMNASRSVS